ncbi:MAG: aldehyde dehydrogenase family protein, partial [Deltaproteobacteria bacterium]|nr:aldehyde dehydrogenase family protein [Deltaproteobacteria bacterium]
MHEVLRELGIESETSGVASGGMLAAHGDWLEVISPIDGKRLARVRQASLEDYEEIMTRGLSAFARWREHPAPKRGEIVRQIGMRLREKKEALGKLVTLEMGKIAAEGAGEVQEMIDIADFAVGLSRQLYGLVIASERPRHRMSEQWHPLGMVGIITAFNFPVAVWSWNAFIAAVCGDVMIWKPSSKTPLCAIAVQKIADEVLSEHGFGGVMSLCVGPSKSVGDRLIHDPRVPLVSATGSCSMGKKVGAAVAQRFGRSLLELGGNNALVVLEDANLELALRAVLFGAVGTAGQRCTSTRRLLLHEPIAQTFLDKLTAAYKQVRIGDPWHPNTVMGPLVDQDAVATMMQALDSVRQQGGEVIYGGKRIERAGGSYVEPTLVRARPDLPIIKEETFAPSLYVLTFRDVDEAILLNNAVPQGLSSSIFTQSMQ